MTTRTGSFLTCDLTARTIGGVAPSLEATMHFLYTRCRNQIDLVHTAAEDVCPASGPTVRL